MKIYVRQDKSFIEDRQYGGSSLERLYNTWYGRVLSGTGGVVFDTTDAIASLDGAVSREQAVKLKICLDFIDEQEKRINELDAEIFRLAQPYSFVLELIRTVPGFNSNPLTAVRILSEIGADMSVFPTAKHLVSWAGCCPRNDQSAQKVKSTRISKAGSFLKPLLVQIANALLKSKE